MPLEPTKPGAGFGNASSILKLPNRPVTPTSPPLNMGPPARPKGSISGTAPGTSPPRTPLSNLDLLRNALPACSDASTSQAANTEKTGLPPSGWQWAAAPAPGTQIVVGPDAREVGSLNGTAHLPEDLRECAEANLEALPNLKGYLGTLKKGEAITVSRDLTEEELSAGTHHYSWVFEKTDKHHLDVHQAEFFIGSQDHGDLVRVPLQEHLPRQAGPLIKVGRRLSAGVDVPRIACFTQPPGSDKVYFRVGNEAVGVGSIVPAEQYLHEQTWGVTQESHDSTHRVWRSFAVGNGHHLIPSLSRGDGELACELMMRMSRGETLDSMVVSATRNRLGKFDLVQRWQHRTRSREAPVQVPQDKAKPLEFGAMVRALREGLHEHGAGMMTVIPPGIGAPRHLVLFDIEMQDAERGEAIVADPDTATVTRVPFGPEQPSLLPPDVREDGSRLKTTTFFQWDSKCGSTPAAPVQPDIGTLKEVASSSPSTFGAAFVERVKSAESRAELVAIGAELRKADLDEESASSLAACAHEALANGLGRTGAVGGPLCKELRLNLDLGYITKDSCLALVTNAKSGLDSCQQSSLKALWSGVVGDAMEELEGTHDMTLEAVVPDEAKRSAIQEVLDFKQ
jgi:hypothetical protein